MGAPRNFHGALFSDQPSVDRELLTVDDDGGDIREVDGLVEHGACRDVRHKEPRLVGNGRGTAPAVTMQSLARQRAVPAAELDVPVLWDEIKIERFPFRHIFCGGKVR